jgi:hypothetical protein
MARCHVAHLRSSAQIGIHMEQAQIAFQMALASRHELGRDALGRHIVGDGLGRMEPFHDPLKFWNRGDASAGADAFQMAQAQIAFRMLLASNHELGRDALGRHLVEDGLGRMETFHDPLKFWFSHEDASA